MRIKVESVPPLPAVKAWFGVHTCTVVSDLKVILCHELQQFRDSDIHGGDIALLLEDFELLDSSPIDVIRDGDLILVKRALAPQSTKRKAPAEQTSSARKRTKHADPGPKPAASGVHARAPSTKLPLNGHAPARRVGAAPTASTSDSDSSTSDSDSESDSGSDSDDSSSESGSDSSSEGSSADSTPSIQPTRGKSAGQTSGPSGAGAQPSTKPMPKSSAPPVPPGLGKPTTHNRNLRRRRKKMYERLELTAEPASVNEIPLGTKARSAEPETMPEPSTQGDGVLVTAPAFMMSTLQNKNKRKGFKNALTSGVPAKILFEGTVDPAQLAVTYSRLIPPSEKQDNGQLPPNMFVTSVDVEEGLRQKRKRKNRAPAPADNGIAEDDVVLPYDDPKEGESIGMQIDSIDPGNVQVAGALNRKAVEAKWSTFTEITDRSQLQVGDPVGWKALGINPATFTPEMLLSIGRVVKCDEHLTVEPHLENGRAEISFGGLIETEDSEMLEETHEWQCVYQGDWRILPRG